MIINDTSRSSLLFWTDQLSYQGIKHLIKWIKTITLKWFIVYNAHYEDYIAFVLLFYPISGQIHLMGSL